jgi:hypothetical protein
MKYELGFYIQEDGILHSHIRENLKCYIFPELENYNGEFLRLRCSCPIFLLLLSNKHLFFCVKQWD